MTKYNENCKPGARERLIAKSLLIGSAAVTARGGVTVRRPSTFYLRKEELGHGTSVRSMKSSVCRTERYSLRVRFEPESWEADLARKKLGQGGYGEGCKVPMVAKKKSTRSEKRRRLQSLPRSQNPYQDTNTAQVADLRLLHLSQSEREKRPFTGES